MLRHEGHLHLDTQVHLSRAVQLASVEAIRAGPWLRTRGCGVSDRYSFNRPLRRDVAALAGHLSRERATEVTALGFDETFRRMWSLYLAYSEAGFRTGYLDVSADER